MLIEIWNRDGITARILGKHWHEYSPPSVLHWFNLNGLKRVVERFGFMEIARGRPQKWISIQHANSLLRYKLKGSKLGRQVCKVVGLLPQMLSIPYPPEDVGWLLFRRI